MPKDLGHIENWLRNIRDVYRLHYDELKDLDNSPKGGSYGDTPRIRRLIELNVAEQCMNVHKLGFVQKARTTTGYPLITGLVFDIKNGILNELPVDLEGYLKNYPNVYKLSHL
eukprot:TRINITY_DN3042_c0_g1_i1.p2 TRINITY_DN3042_c0_g1~~TRINITY_DN3042_c0_g1_i1.p2  ORF type:complete len:113 (+),score=20.35 TRINITY_DN3042_c0_g1_i1:478-816(+)